MKLLAIRLDSAGDVLMCSPALRALHEAGHSVTLLTSNAGALAGERIDGVAQVIRWSAPWMKASAKADADTVPRMAKQLRDQAFDGAVIFTSYSQSPLPAAMLCQMAGIPLRIAHCRENPYQLLTHWIRESEPEPRLRHEVQRQLDLVSELGCRPTSTRLQIRVTDNDEKSARAAVERAGLAPNRPWILLHPGASAPSRRYPIPQWSDAAALLAEKSGLPLLFAGSADEVLLVSDIIGTDKPRWPSVAGQLDFGALAALISMSSLLVACNSAPAHLAAATGTPVVDLYALTNPQHTPWQVPHRLLYRDVPCHDCYQSTCPLQHHPCLAEVMPHDVAAAAMDLLSSAWQPRGRQPAITPS